MKVLVINANRNTNVQKTVDNLEQYLGAGNVDLIEYGLEKSPDCDDTDARNTNELIEILNKKTLGPKQYDLLLVSGGHGEISFSQNKDSFVKTQFNSLTPQGAQILLDYFAKEKIRFDHILLGSCYSASYLQEFKTLLSKPSGSILSFTTMGTHNFCTLAEEIASQKKPCIDGILVNGLPRVMEMLETNQMLGDSLSFEEKTLLSIYNAEVAPLIETANQLSRFMGSISLVEPHSIGDLIERTERQKQNLTSLGMSLAEEKKARAAIDASLVELKSILSTFTSNHALGSYFKSDAEKMDGTKVEAAIKACRKTGDIVVLRALAELDKAAKAYNSSAQLKILDATFAATARALKKKEEEKLVEFMETHYQTLVTSGSSLLTQAVETSLCLYHDNLTYVRTKNPKELPKDVMDISEPYEMVAQLDLVALEVEEMANSGMNIKELDTPAFSKTYIKALKSPSVQALNSTRNVGIFAPKQETEKGLPQASGTIKPQGW